MKAAHPVWHRVQPETKKLIDVEAPDYSGANDLQV